MMIKPTVAQVFGELVAGHHRPLTAQEGMLFAGASEKAAIIEMGRWLAVIDFDERDFPRAELYESGTDLTWVWTPALGSFEWASQH